MKAKTTGLVASVTLTKEVPPLIPMMAYSSPVSGSVQPQMSLPLRLWIKGPVLLHVCNKKTISYKSVYTWHHQAACPHSQVPQSPRKTGCQHYDMGRCLQSLELFTVFSSLVIPMGSWFGSEVVHLTSVLPSVHGVYPKRLTLTCSGQVPSL